jgi:hypothetical protein
MVTDCFRRHGLYVGPCPERNAWGYRTYENETLKKAVHAYYPRPGYPWQRDKAAFEPEPKKQAPLRAKYVENIPAGTRLVLKLNVYYCYVMLDLFPDARLVFVQRDLESHARSMADKKGLPFESLREKLARKHRHLERYAAATQSPIINTTAVLQGDYSSLRAAFEHAGVTYRQDVIDAVVDPGKWHYKCE